MFPPSARIIGSYLSYGQIRPIQLVLATIPLSKKFRILANRLGAPLTGCRNCPPPPRRGEADNSDASRRLRVRPPSSLGGGGPYSISASCFQDGPINIGSSGGCSRRPHGPPREGGANISTPIYKGPARGGEQVADFEPPFLKRGVEDLRVARRDPHGSLRPREGRCESIREYPKFKNK